MAYNIAYRLLACPDTATEATQEAFLAALNDAGAQECSFRVRLLRAVVAACAKRLHRTRSVRPASADGSASADHPLDRDMVRAIEAGIARLPIEARVVLVLADIQGLGYEEIAQVTGASRAAVGRRLGEARARLRDWLYGTRPVMGASSG